jgi:hypothetical protein
MKKSISHSALSLVFILAFAVISNAQYVYQKHGTYYYDELGVVLGNQACLKNATSVMFDNKFIITLGYYYTSRQSPYLPSDYNTGTGLFEISDVLPQQTTSMYGLMVGKVFAAPNRKTRVILRGGFCFGVASTPQNFRRTPTVADPYAVFTSGFSTLLFGNGASYTYDVVDEHTSGLIINPTVEFPLSRFFGLSTGLFANLNSVSSTFGLDVNIIFGKCRSRIDRVGYLH